VRFALAERLIDNGLPEAAQVQLEWLAAEAERHSDAVPEWGFTVALRRCELAAQQGDFARVAQLASENRATYAEAQQSYEFDFLLARSAIGQVDFDTALGALRGITDVDNLPDEIQAKAHWITGEIYFLKQHHAAAIKCYQRTIGLEAPAWQARALLQAAKCQELLGQPAAAYELYKELHLHFGKTPAAKLASERMAGLHAALQATEELH
jgi:TolA-binding protein